MTTPIEQIWMLSWMTLAVPGALSAQGSSSLIDLILLFTECLMNSWKPVIQIIMQQFAEFDNKGYDIKLVLYNIVQNSKAHYFQCKEIHLYGLEFTESPSALNWTERSESNWKGVTLPKTFEELEKIPLDQTYIFLCLWTKNPLIKKLKFWALKRICSGNYQKSEKLSMNFAKSGLQ